VLRYLADTYRALRQTVPSEARTEELTDVVEWLGELVRQVDSSLLDEWEKLAQGMDTAGADAAEDGRPPLDRGPEGVTRNIRAFRVLVRNALFRRVELAACRDLEQLTEMDGEVWEEPLAGYFAEHASIGTGPDARGPGLFLVEEQPERWRVQQILDDPAGDHDWRITAEVDLPASDEEGELVLRDVALVQL
jgi:hypothetical protein